jgi:glycosyltransferase involved in cell wall biosynthesis
MKILQVIASLNPQLGGPVEGLAQFYKALTVEGHCQHVVCLDVADAPWLKKVEYPVFAVGPSFSSYGYTWQLVRWLRSNAHNYDCVIVNGLWQFPGLGTYLALKQMKIPYFVYPHGMLDPWFKHTYPLKHLKKWLYWPWAEYQVLKNAQAVLFTTEDERLLARQSFWLYQCREVVVGYGATLPEDRSPHQQAAFLQQYPHLRDRQLLLFLGRIHPKKGCDLLIESFSKVAHEHLDLHLVMAGPDQVGWQTALRERAQQLGIDQRITWTGMLSGDLKWGALRLADAFVLPSHQENFGIAVIEALACNLPVLISQRVNIHHEVTRDGAGFVANDDLVGTVQLLQEWLSTTLEQKNQMRQCAKACFLKHFEIQQVATKLIHCIEANIATPARHVG